ncbi:MAG: hypothetical protein M0T84_00145 [Betaproteobacteria bacterium]|nr:hypothetical protein [Betaproteobacteria bacterium]
MASEKRSYTADFFCFEEDSDRESAAFRKLLMEYSGNHAPAYALGSDSDVKHQIRSIRANRDHSVFMAVFGRLRHGETPEQATERGNDSDVELLPGHGLVDKSHFLFYPDINLLVLQRNRNAGSRSHFQAYLNKPHYKKRALMPVLSEDSYSKLMHGGTVKKLEISFKRPPAGLAEQSAFLGDCVRMFSDSDAARLKMTLTAEIGGRLLEPMKNAMVKLSKFGGTRVARVTMAEDNEIIDLILDRITKGFDVDLLENGRPDPQSMFAGLARAKDACAEDLKAFFGP